MLHEPASLPDDRPASPVNFELETEPILDESPLMAASSVAQVMDIAGQVFHKWDALPLEDRAVMVQGDVEYMMSFEGYLKLDSESAFELLDNLLTEHNLTALFRERINDGKRLHVIHILEGRMKQPKRSSPIPNLILLVLTFLSMMYLGTVVAIGEIGLSDPALAKTLRSGMISQIWRGLPYAMSLMLIFGAHEMAHWFMMRKYKVIASLPYFLPDLFLTPFGTIGAAINIKSPFRSRKALFDVAIAGPLAGLTIAIPILLIGLSTSQVVEVTPGGMVEGNSALYAIAKILALGQFYPNGTHDVMLNQLAWAGWTGILFTALNLIPLGQLDGGHIIYALFGDRARNLYHPILAVSVFLALFVSTVWILLFLMLLFLGRIYAVPLNNITRIDPLRQRLAYAMIAIFALIFIPAPILISGQSGGLFATLMIGIIWQTLRYRGFRLKT